MNLLFFVTDLLSLDVFLMANTIFDALCVLQAYEAVVFHVLSSCNFRRKRKTLEMFSVTKAKWFPRSVKRARDQKTM